MTVEVLGAYLPMDRRMALAAGDALPIETAGSVLLADISGFTPLTEALVAGLGTRRGAEELTRLLNEVYTRLVSRVHHFGGSVICFIGDALTAFFPDDQGLRAVACGLQMQRAMVRFTAIASPQGGRISLRMKAAVAVGPVRRFVVGDPEIRRMDVLVGATVDRLTQAEHLAERGEVLGAPEVGRKIGRQLVADAWRGRCAVIAGVRENVRPAPWKDLPEDGLTPERLRPYLHRAVFDRVEAGQGEFLAELRPVSVLFLRFVGIDYDNDRDAGEKLDAFTRWVQAVAERYGGHVLLLTTADKGSHLYVVFGALEAHEDDRQRAVAAAMRLVTPPPALGFVGGLQIGVSHGRARVGAYGGETRRTYGALGDAVNLAARLMAAAPIGEIRCSDAIHEAAKRRWTFDTLPAVTLKGLDRPQPVYRPRRRRQTTEPAAAVAASDGLIGRRSELAVVARTLRETKGGARRILLIEGEAGIGKSRLIEEIARRATSDGFTTLFGAADSIESRTPYRVWRELLGGLFGIDGADEPDVARARVLEGINAFDPGAVERAPLLNDILELAVPESRWTESLGPEVRAGGLAALIGDLLTHRASVAPLLLVVEDAHWLDSLSWDLAISVARTLAHRPALVVVSHRPHGDVVPPQYAALAAMSGAQTLTLGSLPPAETVEIAAARLGLSALSLPEAVASLLAERAEGNPFFAVELIGALRDRELLVIEGGACTVAGDEAALSSSVPDTLEGVILARMDRLPTEEQLTVKVAAVIGRSFLLRTVHDVHPAGFGTGRLREQLDHTSRRRLTVLESEDPEPCYAFQHIVTQQVAYETLLFEQRRELHRDIATWFEETYANHLEPHVPRLVVHWNRAGHGENECRYCVLAGKQAAARHANVEAEIHFARALELIDELDRRGSSERRFDVLERRARILGLLGRVDEERLDLERLLPIAEASGGASKRGEVLLLWSDFHRRCGQFDESLERAEAALDAMREAGSSTGAARALTGIGNALEGEGRFREARAMLEKALEAFRGAGANDGRAENLKSLGIIAARIGELPRAMEHFVRARELYRESGDRKGEADILGNLGALSYYRGNYETCIEYTEQAQPLFHEMGNPIGSAKCLTNLGNSYSALGAFGEALEQHRRALEVYEQLEDASGCADSLCNMAIARGALGIGGQLELTFRRHGHRAALLAAVESARKAMALYSKIGSQRGEVISYFNLGMLHLCIGEIDVAEVELSAALRLSRELGLERLVMRSLSALARARLLAGKVEQAARLSSEAIELLGDRTSPEAIEIHFTQSHVLGASDASERASHHLEAARRLVRDQAATIAESSTRDRFLSTYGELLEANGIHGTTPPR